MILIMWIFSSVAYLFISFIHVFLLGCLSFLLVYMDSLHILDFNLVCRQYLSLGY